MGGGQTSTQNSIQTTEQSPWNPAQPGLMKALTDAGTLYDAGIGNGIYGGNRVAGLSDAQQNGIQGTIDQAASDNAGAQGVSYLQNLMASGGISPTTQQGLNMLAAVPEASTARLSALADRIGSASNPINQTANAFMSGARDLTTIPQLQGLFAQTQTPSYAEQNLAGVARGDYLDPTQNKIFQNLVDTSSHNALQAQKEAFAASGRYGSGAFAGAANKAVNDTQSQLYASQYNQERANQASANSQMDAAMQGRLGLGSNVLGQIGSVESTNNQQRLAGAGLGQAQQSALAGVLGQVLGGDQFNSNLGVTKANGFIGAGQQGTNAGLAAAGALPGVDALRYAPASNLLQVGGLQQSQAQNLINADMQRFQETQQTPWQALSEYASFPTAIGSMGGQTVSRGTQQTRTSGPSGLQSILGLGTSLLGLGTGGGATLGGSLAMGLLGSDERLKEDIHPVGELKDGQPVYAYRYKGDPRVQIGLLAHEVAEKNPDAVGPIGLGDLMGVDYGKATAEAARLAAKGKRKGRGSQLGGSSPAAPPAEPPRMTIVMSDQSGVPSDLPAGLGSALAMMLPGSTAGDGLVGDALRAVMPSELPPVRTGSSQTPTRGKRRAAA
ncbi:tail fiber domain-containing protein [Methylobacterium sp. D53M]